MEFIGRISGIVTYSDDTHDQFAAHRDSRGNISVNAGIGDTPNSSNAAIREVQAGNNWLEDMLALVSGTLALSATGVVAKTVTGMVAHFSGRIARTNDTFEDFAVQYDIKAGGEFILNSSGAGTGGGEAGDDVTAYTEFLGADLIAWLDQLVGVGNTVAP